MKSIGTGIVLAVGLLFAAAIHTFAIEGLQISVQCSNVVLSWPSAEGETYIVQYRKTLDPSDSWQTLTSSLPAVSGTNVTSFVHLNIVQNPCGCGGSAFAAMASGRNTLALAAAEPIAPAPMAIPADGSGGAVPLALYPPGFDLSGFLIFDPLTGESVSGSGYSASALALDSLQFDGPQPLDGGGGSGNSTPAPETGFYQVVRDGVYLLNSSLAKLTNGAVSNTVTVAFEAGNAASDGTGTNILGNLACAALIIDGGKFAGDGGVVGFPLSPFFMDTAYLENGNHSLQVEVTWLNPDNSDGNHVNITRRSNPVTITVSNQIYYPQWEPEVGEAGISAYFLKTIFTNVDWKIDIYDVSNKLAQTITNHTDDGTIEAYWNLVDTNGVTRTNADVDPVFSAIVTVYDAPISKPTPGKKQRQKNWPDHAVWTMAYQDFFKFEYSANNLMQYAINAFTLTAGKYGGYWIYYPQPGQTNDYGQTYPMRYQKTNHLDTNITQVALFLDQQLLRRFLSNTNSRNFFYDGHGNAYSFADIDPNVLKWTVQHRYRFVMIDACSSANGNSDQVFGIKGPGRFAQSYYHNTGIRPGAFCGYNTDVDYATGGPVTINGVLYDDTIPDSVPYFITNFIFYWDPATVGYRLNDAIYYASNALSPPGGYNDREDHWVIYGYDDLRIDDFNHASDTW